MKVADALFCLEGQEGLSARPFGTMNIINSFFKKNKIAKAVFEYGVFLLGCLIVAVAFNTLLLPNKLASGGVVGLSIIIQDLFHINPAYLQWFINIPIFIAGILVFGPKSAVKATVGSLALPLFILLTESASPLTLNPLLGGLYGGLMLGLGLGLVFRSKGSTGGFSILALILARYFPITIGSATMIMDAAVIILAGFVFSPENAMYALIVVFIMSKTIDFIQLGLTLSKVAYVISEYEEQITEGVLNELARGATKLHATGAYSGMEKQVLMIVLDRSEVSPSQGYRKTDRSPGVSRHQ